MVREKSSGQALVILAISFMAILAFVGFATDAGSLYITYTQLKRGVDAAALAAADNIKVHNPGETLAQRETKIYYSALEMLKLNNVANLNSLEVYLCSDSNKPASFANMCPNIAAGQAARKLAWVQATQDAPVYFLRLFGIQNVPITVSSVGEAPCAGGTARNQSCGPDPGHAAAGAPIAPAPALPPSDCAYAPVHPERPVHD